MPMPSLKLSGAAPAPGPSQLTPRTPRGLTASSSLAALPGRLAGDGIAPLDTRPSQGGLVSSVEVRSSKVWRRT